LIRARLKTPRAAAIAGILFSVLLITGLLLFRISVRADPPETGAWLKTRSNAVALALNDGFDHFRVSSGNGILRTLRSSVSSWAAVRGHVMRNAKPPAQNSGLRNTSFPVKRAVIEFWSFLF